MLSEENASTIGNDAHSALANLLIPVNGKPKFLLFDRNTKKLVESMDAFSNIIYDELGTEDIPNVPIEGDCGGSVQAKGNYQNFSFVASSYCEMVEGVDVTANGSGSFVTNETTQYKTFKFEKFSLSFDDTSTPPVTITGDIGRGENEKLNQEVKAYADMEVGDATQSINMIHACGAFNNCDYDIEFTALNDAVYKVINLNYAFNGNYSLDGSGKIYLPDHGKVSFDYADIQLCSTGIASGSIVLMDQGSNTVSIGYSQCGVEPTVSFTAAN